MGCPSNDEVNSVWIRLVGTCKPLNCNDSVTCLPHPLTEEVCHQVKFLVCSSPHTVEYGKLCYPAHLYSIKMGFCQTWRSNEKSPIGNSSSHNMTLQQNALTLVATSYHGFECQGYWKSASHTEVGGNSKVNGVPTNRIENHGISSERKLSKDCSLLVSLSSVNFQGCD
ncbi:hypothetical protein Ancab_024071 [Ancistrocladus abbreviatus]